MRELFLILKFSGPTLACLNNPRTWFDVQGKIFSEDFFNPVISEKIKKNRKNCLIYVRYYECEKNLRNTLIAMLIFF